LARLLRHFPFVRGLVLTGSVSADDAREHADIDLLVIVAPGRLGTAFLLLGPASRLLGRLFCPNWYVTADQLGVAPASSYIGREFAQARPLAGGADPLREANPWLIDRFPNAVGPPTADRPLQASTRLSRLLEASLRGSVGERVERWGRRVAHARLSAHYRCLDQDVPLEVAASFDAGIALRFHGYRYDQRTTVAYAARRTEVMGRAEPAAGKTLSAVGGGDPG
jgi:Nucleotidyltransferase domain